MVFTAGHGLFVTMSQRIANLVTWLLAWRYWRTIHRQRKELRLLRYIYKVHERPRTVEETIAHFWLGQMYARHGTDEQLGNWYHITLGSDGDDDERLAQLEHILQKSRVHE